MSNALAIAAVTAVLRDLINDTMVDQGLSSIVGSTVNVTALAPDLVKTDLTGTNQLNLFLYQVTPNIGWRNFDQPARDARGDRITQPLLALDLHYLLTAYSDKDLHAEIMLGYAMQYLHELCIVSREIIHDKETTWAASADASVRAMAKAQLADQVEQIKIVPQGQSVEEMSKLWAAFQAKYRPTAGYLVTVVLIESNVSARSPLPVLTIGVNDSGVKAIPNLIPPYPVLNSVIPPSSQLGVQLNQTLTLKGYHLDGDPGDTVKVVVNNLHFSAPVNLTPTSVKTSEVQVAIPNDPDNYPAGAYTVAIGFDKGAGIYRLTNELPFVLVPNKPTLPAGPLARAGDGSLTVTATITPKVWQGQRAYLFLGDHQAVALPFVGSKTNSLQFVFSAIPANPAYLYRLRVDGADSEFIDRTKTPPVFFPGQTIAVT